MRLSSDEVEDDVGLLADFFMGSALTGLTSMCEEIDRCSEGGFVGRGGFDALPVARRAELERKVPKWLATLRKSPPETVTVNIIRNLQLANLSGRHQRAHAMVRMTEWLVSEGIAADPDQVLGAR